MRSSGQRLSGSDHGLRQSVFGWLYFGPTPLDDYGPRQQARLLNKDGADLISPLQYARILRMDGVIHIAGVEYYLRGRKGSPQKYKQSWLVCRKPEDAIPLLAKIDVVRATGFSDEEMADEFDQAGFPP